MEAIVNALVKMNQRDWFDILTVVIPILLSVVIIVQNKVYAARTTELQKIIHNREWAQQYHGDILLLYNMYYEFIDIIQASGFEDNVRSGNVNAALGWIGNIQMLKVNMLRRQDLARLLFEKKNKNLYHVIEKTFEQELEIVNKYITYLTSGKLLETSENAWNAVCLAAPGAKYNYQWLFQNRNAYDNFMKLCHSEEMVAIECLMKENDELHSYENFDKYFEEYFAIEKLS